MLEISVSTSIEEQTLQIGLDELNRLKVGLFVWNDWIFDQNVYENSIYSPPNLPSESAYDLQKLVCELLSMILNVFAFPKTF